MLINDSILEYENIRNFKNNRNVEQNVALQISEAAKF